MRASIYTKALFVKCVCCLLFAPSLLLGNPFTSLSNQELSGVEWDSVSHKHLYSNQALQRSVAAIVDLLEASETGFLRDWNALSSSHRARLKKDSLDSRSDYFDLVSVELKLRIEKALQESFDSRDYLFNHSEIWSLAKHRFRSLYGIESDSTGLSVFRSSPASSVRYIVGCADNYNAPEQAKLQIAGLSFAEFSGPASWNCKSEHFNSQLEAHKESPKLRFREEWDWERIESDGRIVVFANIGLVETLSDKLLQPLVRYLKWKTNFDNYELKEVDLKPAIEPLLAQSDLFVSLINLPHANAFRFSMTSERGRLLSFKRSRLSESGRALNLEFHIILPPATLGEGQDAGVSFQQADLLRLWEMDGPPSVLDIACYSDRYMKDWMSVMVPSLMGDAELPPLILSSSGQRAEAPWEIFLVLDVVAGAIQRFFDQEDLAEVSAYLEGPTIWQFIAGFVNGGWRELPRTDFQNPYLFLPMLSTDSDFAELSNWSEYFTLKVEGGRNLRFYPPVSSSRLAQ